MVNIKKILAKIMDILPTVEIKNSWLCFKYQNYCICSQAFTLTPSAASTTTNRTIDLPFTMYSSSSYYVHVTLNSRAEVTTCIVAGHRDSATQAQLSVYASNTSPRSVYCTVIGRTANQHE